MASRSFTSSHDIEETPSSASEAGGSPNEGPEVFCKLCLSEQPFAASTELQSCNCVFCTAVSGGQCNPFFQDHNQALINRKQDPHRPCEKQMCYQVITTSRPLPPIIHIAHTLSHSSFTIVTNWELYTRQLRQLSGVLLHYGVALFLAAPLPASADLKELTHYSKTKQSWILLHTLPSSFVRKCHNVS